MSGAGASHSENEQQESSSTSQVPQVARSFGRSLKDFGQILPAEKLLMQAVATGTTCEISRERPAGKMTENEIRAEFIRFLALGGDAQTPVHEKGIDIYGAYISGVLDFENCKNIGALKVKRSLFENVVNLHGGSYEHVTFSGSHLPGLFSGRCTIQGSLRLCKNFLSTGEVRLNGAQIMGQLVCYESVFENSEGYTILCRAANIRGGVDLTHSKMIGKTDFSITEIGGDLNLSGAKLISETGYALDCYDTTISNNLHLDNGFEAHGGVYMIAAKIGGMSSFSKGHFYKRNNEYAIDALSVRNDGPLYMRDGFEAHGGVRMNFLQTKAKLDCRGGHFLNSERSALQCNFARLDGDVLLVGGFHAKGSVKFIGCTIGGDLACDGGTFESGNNLEKHDETAESTVLSNTALDLAGTVIQNRLWFVKPHRVDQRCAKIKGSVRLTGTHAKLVIDHPNGWPQGEGNYIELDGFTYERFAGSPCDAKTRIEWLQKQPKDHLDGEFRPQPFQHLNKVLREMGHEEEALKIAIFKKKHLLKMRFSQKPWAAPYYFLEWLFLGQFLGYGYRPMRLVTLMAVVWLASALIFAAAAEQNVFAPKDPEVFLEKDLQQCRPSNGGRWIGCAPEIARKYEEYPSFNPYLYSLDLMISVADFKQENEWIPMKRSFHLTLPVLGQIGLPDWFAKALMWFEIAFGLIGGLLLVAAFSGVVKKD